MCPKSTKSGWTDSFVALEEFPASAPVSWKLRATCRLAATCRSPNSSKTSGTWRDSWPRGVSPVSRWLNHPGEEKIWRKKEAATDVALQINAQNPGARTAGGEKKNARRSRCVEEATPGGSLLWTARRQITHPHMDAADAGPERAAEYVSLAIGRRLSAAWSKQTGTDSRKLLSLLCFFQTTPPLNPPPREN